MSPNGNYAGGIGVAGRLFVKPVKILFMCLCLQLLGCASSERVKNRDYAFDTYYPTANEIQLAQQRAQRYWQKRRFKSATQYLAVCVMSVDQVDVVQNLLPIRLRMNNT